jgi:hypothetical protein
MPILTPCADAGAASNRLHAATAAKNPDFIFMFSHSFYQEKSTRDYFYIPTPAIYFGSANGIASPGLHLETCHPEVRAGASLEG